MQTTLHDQLAEEVEHLDDQFVELIELLDYLTGSAESFPHSSRMSRFLCTNLCTVRQRVADLRAELWRVGCSADM